MLPLSNLKLFAGFHVVLRLGFTVAKYLLCFSSGVWGRYLPFWSFRSYCSRMKIMAFQQKMGYSKAKYCSRKQSWANKRATHVSGFLGPMCLLFSIYVGSSLEQWLSHLIFQIIRHLTCKKLNKVCLRPSCGVCSPCWIWEDSVLTIRNTDISAYNSIGEIAIHQSVSLNIHCLLWF